MYASLCFKTNITFLHQNIESLRKRLAQSSQVRHESLIDSQILFIDISYQTNPA